MSKKRKKILILGATGLLGSYIFNILANDKSLNVFGMYKNIKKVRNFKKKENLIKIDNIIFFHKLKKKINKLKPDVVINCCGIIKQKKFIQKKKLTYIINSRLPKYLDKISQGIKFKLIHFSTDCVFSGKSKIGYNENSKIDASDLYGKSKAKGENLKNNSLVFRTSFIGHEFHGEKKSLLDWFINETKTVYGFKKVYFTGLTSLFIALFIKNNIKKILGLNGIYHLSGKKISKYELLKKINKIYKLNKIIKPHTKIIMNRSLRNYKLKRKIFFRNPSWEKLLSDLSKEKLLKNF